MKFLLLGSAAQQLNNYFDRFSIANTTEPITLETLEAARPDWLISFGYRHIVPQSVLNAMGGRAINLHISLLPWNRGADPNLWSWLEDTPKGVTIHWMTEDLDRGDIVAQRPVELLPQLTLRQSYESLTSNISELFADVVSQIKSGSINREPQKSGGSYHRLTDKSLHKDAIPLGWDTPCEYVRTYGRLAGLSRVVIEN